MMIAKRIIKKQYIELSDFPCQITESNMKEMLNTGGREDKIYAVKMRTNANICYFLSIQFFLLIE